MTTLGYDQAMALRAGAMPLAYFLCTLSLVLTALRHGNDFHPLLLNLVGIAVIVILINGYPGGLVTIADAFKELRQQTTASVPNWREVFQAKYEDPQWYQVGEKIALLVCQAFKNIGQVSVWFLDWVQAWAFNGLVAVSPIVLGALALPWTQGIGVQFLMTSFGVAAWHLGIALVDVLLANAAVQIAAFGGMSGGITAATVVSTGALPVFAGILAGITLLALALYLAVPLVIAALLRGDSPLTTGAKAGAQWALTGLGMGSMGAVRLGAGLAVARARRGGAEGGAPPPPRPPGGGGGPRPLAPAPLSPWPEGGGPFPGRGIGSGDAAALRQTRLLAAYAAPPPGRPIRRRPRDAEDSSGQPNRSDRPASPEGNPP